MKISLALILAVGVAISAALPQASEPSRDIQGARVYRVRVASEAELTRLSELQLSTQLDFWTEPRNLGFVDIMARKWEIQELERFLVRFDLSFEIQIPDVAELVAEQDRLQQAARAESQGMDWTSYHTYDEIMAWLDSVAAAHPDIATVTDVGTSFEGRTMKLLKLSTGGQGKGVIFSDGGIHAREWISPATVTYIIDQLVSGGDEGLLASVDFYFMPSINPDGYQYSIDHDRMWRKTRSQRGERCIGVDPNRNWDFHWMEGGASQHSCSEVYAGPEPFSEVEMQVVRDVILDIKPRVYLTFHSYSQMWLYPWGYTPLLPENWRDLDSLAQDAVAALTAVYGTVYQIGSSTNTLSLATGGSDDWAMAVGGAEYSYTVELRDTGTFGFLLPPVLILPTAQETYEAFKVVGRFIAGNQ